MSMLRSKASASRPDSNCSNWSRDSTRPDRCAKTRNRPNSPCVSFTSAPSHPADCGRRGPIGIRQTPARVPGLQVPGRELAPRPPWRAVRLHRRHHIDQGAARGYLRALRRAGRARSRLADPAPGHSPPGPNPSGATIARSISSNPMRLACAALSAISTRYPLPLSSRERWARCSISRPTTMIRLRIQLTLGLARTHRPYPIRHLVTSRLPRGDPPVRSCEHDRFVAWEADHECGRNRRQQPCFRDSGRDGQRGRDRCIVRARHYGASAGRAGRYGPRGCQQLWASAISEHGMTSCQLTTDSLM